MTCPRCLGEKIEGRTCIDCNVEYDNAAALDITSRVHWAVRRKYDARRDVDYVALQRGRMDKLLGLDT